MTHVNGSDTAANRRAVDPLGKGERRSEEVGGRGIGYVHAGVERPTTNAVFANIATRARRGSPESESALEVQR
jgi:hypothetical protein